MSTDFEDFEKLLSERYSCRAFKPEPVPRNVIEQLLRAAQRTASDCNVQPWRVRVVSSDALERLRKAMYERAASGAERQWDIPPIESYAGVYRERRRECGWGLYEAVGIARGDRAASHAQAMENFRFFGAPHFALVTTNAALGARGIADCGGYVMTFLLAAQAAGLGAVAQASVSHRVDVIRQVIELAGDEHVLCGISFGWPVDGHPANRFRTTRAPIEEVVEFIDA